MRNLFTVAAVFALVLGLASAAPAVDPAPTNNPPAAAAGATAPAKIVNNTTAALGMGLSVIGIGIGLGLIGFAALSGIARQPEQAGAIQGAMFIIAGLVEGAGIISLVLCLVTIFV